MNKYLISLVSLLTLAWAQVRGADSLPILTASVEEVRNGQEWILHVAMDNPSADNLTALQMDCSLPDGVEYVDGSAVTDIRLTDHTVYTGQQSDGSLRIGLLSFSNSPITGTEGELVSLRLRSATPLAEGSYPLSFDNISLVARDGTQMLPVAFSTTLVSSPAVEATYTLTYLLDGTTYAEQTYRAGETITPPANPEREGYTFAGWQDLPATMPATDLIVSATMTVNSYTVTYYLDDEVYTTQDVAFGGTVTPPAEPEREGYTFSGWQDVPATMPASDLSIYGTMTVNTYTVTYYLDGEVYTTQNVAFGETITPPAAPEREGYIFSGWQDIPATMPATDLSIYGTMQLMDGIHNAGYTDRNAAIYDLQGRRINGNRADLPRGIYIIGGRKVLVK